MLLLLPGWGEQPADGEPLQPLHESLQEPLSWQQPGGAGFQLPGPHRGAGPVGL